MDRSADDLNPDQIREKIRLTRASVDNQLELLRLRRFRYLAYAAAAAVVAASVVAAVELVRSRRTVHAED